MQQGHLMLYTEKYCIGTYAALIITMVCYLKSSSTIWNIKSIQKGWVYYCFIIHYMAIRDEKVFLYISSSATFESDWNYCVQF